VNGAGFTWDTLYYVIKQLEVVILFVIIQRHLILIRFWGVNSPCGLVGSSQRFRSVLCPSSGLNTSTMKMGTEHRTGSGARGCNRRVEEKKIYEKSER
jgi:hypothetical protein